VTIVRDTDSQRTFPTRLCVMTDQPKQIQLHPSFPRRYLSTSRRTANFCSIAHTPFDFTLTFCEVMRSPTRRFRTPSTDHVVCARRCGEIVVAVQFCRTLICRAPVHAGPFPALDGSAFTPSQQARGDTPETIPIAHARHVLSYMRQRSSRTQHARKPAVHDGLHYSERVREPRLSRCATTLSRVIPYRQRP